MRCWIEWTYKPNRGKPVILTTDMLKAEEALFLSDDFEKTGRTKDLFFYDEKDTKWTKKELKKLLKEIETEPQEIIAYFDGGFDLDTNRAGLGAAIYYEQTGKKYRIRANQLFEEIDSNNEAEYAAFWFTLRQLEELGVHNDTVTFRGDSQVVLNQLSGEWPCFEDVFNKWLDRIEQKIKELGIHPLYESINRKDNMEADKLATQALEGTDIHSKIEIP